MGARQVALPVDETLIHKCETLIHKMNRSERRRVHRTLLDESRNAADKLITANDNIVACRLPRDAYAALLNIVADGQTDLSAFARYVILKAIKEHTQ